MDAAPPLLVAADPVPAELVNAAAPGALVLTCEHGGRALPRALASGAPGPRDMARHIAWDVGAAALARRLAQRLGAPLALQPYSRLVIDCNRPRHAADLAPAVSDGTPVPFNQGLEESELDIRWQTIHQPFHAAVARLLDARSPAALVAVHSFAPRLRGGPPRRMMAGLLARADLRLAEALHAALLAAEPGLAVVLNAPYRIEDDSDYTIPVHGERRGLPHVLIEVRNDLIARPAGVARWTGLLPRAFGEALPRLLGKA
jgi:predicted N-formylglutamate amidohydrolase